MAGVSVGRLVNSMDKLPNKLSKSQVELYLESQKVIRTVQMVLVILVVRVVQAILVVLVIQVIRVTRVVRVAPQDHTTRILVAICVAHLNIQYLLSIHTRLIIQIYKYPFLVSNYQLLMRVGILLTIM